MKRLKSMDQATQMAEPAVANDGRDVRPPSENAESPT
jgi:hypothetical protein